MKPHWLDMLLGNMDLNDLFMNQIDMVLEFTVGAVLELISHWKG